MKVTIYVLQETTCDCLYTRLKIKNLDRCISWPQDQLRIPLMCRFRKGLQIYADSKYAHQKTRGWDLSNYACAKLFP